jgi:hypothetical protein
MQKHYLTSHHNFDLGYICRTDIQLKGLPPTVSVDGDVLLRKNEFHISLVCTKRLAPLINPVNPKQAEQALVATFVDFVQKTPLIEFTLTGKFYLVNKGDRKTVVALCEMPGLAELFAHLNQALGVDLPVQPAHITLYTLQPDAGIGVLSEDELHQIGKLIDLPQLIDLKQQ